nr:hypothetical protein [Candidatus Sigynarchaeota archaeon]
MKLGYKTIDNDEKIGKEKEEAWRLRGGRSAGRGTWRTPGRPGARGGKPGRRLLAPVLCIDYRISIRNVCLCGIAEKQRSPSLCRASKSRFV